MTSSANTGLPINDLKSDTLKTLFDFDYQKDVVFCDAFCRDDEVLQFSAQNATSSVQLWGRPFDAATGGVVRSRRPLDSNADNRMREITYHNGVFDRRRRLCGDASTGGFFHRQKGGLTTNDITPWEFTRWLADNTEGLVILVSTNFINLFNPGAATGDVGGKRRRFLNHCLETRPKTSDDDGEPLWRCHWCDNVATFVTRPVFEGRVLCAAHARRSTSHLSLYVPVLIDITVASDAYRMSVYDVPTPFQRDQDWGLHQLRGTGCWTPLLKASHGAAHVDDSKKNRISLMDRIHAATAGADCLHHPEVDDCKNGAASSVATARCLLRALYSEAARKGEVTEKLLTPEPRANDVVFKNIGPDRESWDSVDKVAAAAADGWYHSSNFKCMYANAQEF